VKESATPLGTQLPPEIAEIRARQGEGIWEQEDTIKLAKFTLAGIQAEFQRQEEKKQLKVKKKKAQAAVEVPKPKETQVPTVPSPRPRIYHQDLKWVLLQKNRRIILTRVGPTGKALVPGYQANPVTLHLVAKTEDKKKVWTRCHKESLRLISKHKKSQT
jgi:hypothetical protein